MMGDTGPLRAIIYLRSTADLDWCANWCNARGYHVANIVFDREGTSWPEVWGLALAGEVDVIVVRALAEIPDWVVPRVEEARESVPDTSPPPSSSTSSTDPDDEPPNRRRPRPLR